MPCRQVSSASDLEVGGRFPTRASTTTSAHSPRMPTVVSSDRAASSRSPESLDWRLSSRTSRHGQSHNTRASGRSSNPRPWPVPHIAPRAGTGSARGTPATTRPLRRGPSRREAGDEGSDHSQRRRGHTNLWTAVQGTPCSSWFAEANTSRSAFARTTVTVHGASATI